MTDLKGNPPDKHRNAKLVFGGGALLSVLTGLAIYLFAGRLGLDEWTANMLALFFIGCGIGDYLFLQFWDRWSKRK